MDIQAIRTRCEAATPGPWSITKDPDIDECLAVVTGSPSTGPEYYSQCVACSIGDLTKGETADAEFIAHARQDIPVLVAEVERLEEEAHAARTEAEANAMYLRWAQERNAALEAAYNAKVAELNEMELRIETLLP